MLPLALVPGIKGGGVIGGGGAVAGFDWSVLWIVSFAVRGPTVAVLMPLVLVAV